MAYTPLAGKTGRITIGAENMHLSEWNLTVSGDPIPVDRFDKTAVNGIYWKEILVGLVGGEATVSGRWDSANTPTSAPHNLIPDGSQITGIYLGISAAVGFTLKGKVTSFQAGQSVSDAGTFSCTIFVEEVTTFPT